MKLKKIKLLEQWENAGTTYAVDEYDYLEVDPDTAKDLVGKGIAEDYTKTSADPAKTVTKVEGKPESQSFTLEDVAAIMAKAIEPLTKAQRKPIPQITVAKPLSVLDDPKGGFKSLPHFAHEIAMFHLRGRVSKELNTWQRATDGMDEEAPDGTKALRTDVDSAAGDLIPAGYVQDILKIAHDSGLVYTRCRRVPLAGNSTKIPAFDETSRVAGSRRGGVRGYWEDEADTHTEGQFKTRKIGLNLHKVVCFCDATDEMLEDSAFPMESMINELFGEEIAFMLDEAIVRGDGVGKPLGILNAGCTVSQAKEGGQAATTLVAENIIKMASRLHARSFKNAVWLINQDTLPQLFTMSLAVGTGGQLVYTPPGGLSDSPYGSLFARPVVPVESCSTLGTVGDIVLADLSQYLYAEKTGGARFASSMHLYFDRDRTAFKLSLRCDGQPWWNAALTPNQGANTQSPFVTCATRA